MEAFTLTLISLILVVMNIAFVVAPMARERTMKLGWAVAATAVMVLLLPAMMLATVLPSGKGNWFCVAVTALLAAGHVGGDDGVGDPEKEEDG